jgi:hypothetical protein
MTDRVFATAGDWALASDGIQWILQRRYGTSWRNVSFVHSTKDILARCMSEKGVEVPDARQLLSGLPDTFDQWKLNQTASGLRLPLSA